MADCPHCGFRGGGPIHDPRHNRGPHHHDQRHPTSHQDCHHGGHWIVLSSGRPEERGVGRRSSRHLSHPRALIQALCPLRFDRRRDYRRIDGQADQGRNLDRHYPHDCDHLAGGRSPSAPAVPEYASPTRGNTLCA